MDSYFDGVPPGGMIRERVADGSTEDCFLYRPLTAKELKWRERRETAGLAFLVVGLGALALGPWLVGLHFIIKFW